MKKFLSILLAAMMLLSTAAYAVTNVSESTPLDESGRRLVNIELAAEKLDGYTIPAGASFSFNEVVGPRTEENGYVSAQNARDAYVVGGGVSQVATTLYLALLDLQSGIEFTEIDVYGRDEYKASYVADRNFAIVTDYAAEKDFAFTNNFKRDLKINMWVEDEALYCKLSTTGSDNLALAASAFGWNSKNLPKGVELLGSSRIKLDSKTTSKAMTRNITRAASEVHNVTVKAGETFSFNEAVGPRTQRFGYINAKNGRGSFVVGGGVAQVASALWLAIEDIEGIDIVEKTTYGEDYNQTYVESAYDAIVTDYANGTDFVFANNSGKDITIAMFIENANIYCRVVC